ncbi:acyltransferase [Paenibacillus sp. J2TS4]|uniref:acyltransferase n=1 Tax=Paenibacillus sp. J2TS4 TaxID=2807194 RepID=UPI001B001367|nr:acyltransferase [Paenibacillus sp. J2TS4]GIP34495.1 membrane protein [Paenibacillus sp. J2TS4]
MKKPRITEIQHLRSLAFLAVVLQHTIGHYAYEPDVNLADGVALALLLLAVKFAVPLFVFITGLVLFYNYEGPLRYIDFMAKRFKDIVVPYLVWSAVYYAVSWSWNKDVMTEIIEFLRLAVTGKASYHLWYVIMILQFYLFFPVLRRAVLALQRKLDTRARTYAALLVMAGLYVYLMTLVWPINLAAEQWNIPVITPMFTEYADRNGLYFIYYFLLGAVAGIALHSWKSWIKRYRVPINLFFIAMFCYFAYRVISGFQLEPVFQIHFNDLFLLRPVMAVYLIASIMVMYGLTMRLTERIDAGTNRWLNVIGRYSYGAYLVHALMLKGAVPLADWLLDGMNVTLRTMLAFVLCSAMSVVVTMLLSRTPIGKAVTGIGASRRTSRQSAA